MTESALGLWSGGRYMHFGEKLDEQEFVGFLADAHDVGLRTFVTADVYGQGEADRMLGRALEGMDRDACCIVGCVGHDFYRGERAGAKGFPRFTDPALRGPSEYGDYLRMAVERSLERCGIDRFDVLLLHNPDLTGYSSEAVWNALGTLRSEGLAERLGIAPGPANGFTLDIIHCFERFGSLIDWAMIILNPLEPWPGSLCLEAAQSHKVRLLTRVVDHGGLFHDDVRHGHVFADKDHRLHRPKGWIEAGIAKIERMRPVAERHGLTLLQLACLWNLSQNPVRSVCPTLIRESRGKPLGTKLRELAKLPAIRLTATEVEEIRAAGDNTGCMALKGASTEHTGPPLPDRWEPQPFHFDAAARWGINPARDLASRH